MKLRPLLSMSLLLMLGLPVFAAEPTPIIADDIDAINYSFGFSMGEKMSQREVDLRAEAFSDGLYDAIGQKVPRLSEEVMAQLLKQELKPSDPPEHFRLPGQKFISENSSKDGVVTLASGLQYKVLKVGPGVKTPKLADSVRVHYIAKTIDGNVFSSTYPQGIPTPQEVRVNQGVAGWKEALMLMHEGDRWELTIPTRLAYRDTGPMGGQTVIIDVELLEIFSAN